MKKPGMKKITAPENEDAGTPVYCSLDIETTGFDPLIEEVLEVGFVFFKTTAEGLKPFQEWTQVFCPSKPVSPKILGLTGITPKELAAAPQFEEFKDFLQEKLGNAVIVGHNIAFDIKFLENFGLKFSGGQLDTLELVQWLLPSHHSYNLENLMHFFKIPHEEAHRALADAKAALLVLEKLLGLYAELPSQTRARILEIIKPFHFTWAPLLPTTANFKPKAAALGDKKAPEHRKSGKAAGEFEVFKLVPGVLYDFPLFSQYAGCLLEKLNALKRKSLLVVPKKQQVMDIWRSGKAQSVFLPAESFEPARFEAMLNKGQHTPEEAKFLLKLLVWQATNWQQQGLGDLNLTFFGGQFKSAVARSEFLLDKTAKIWVCDTHTFLSLSRSNGALAERLVTVVGLPELESALSLGISHRVSWSFITYLLKSYYNPETQTGSLSYEAMVQNAINEADLFFGLASALLKQNPSGFEYFKVLPGTEQADNFQKVKQAAANYALKLLETAQSLEAEALAETARNLQAFFEDVPNRVKWVELAEGRCIFYDNPVNLKEPMEQITGACGQLCFADSLSQPKVVELFLSRLGLETLKVKKVQTVAQTRRLLQGDLFSGWLGRTKAECQLRASGLLDPELKACLKPSSLPAAVLFAGPLQVKEFYEQNYEELQAYANVLSQNHSGGSNKLFRNFEIYPESILLATDKLILKYLTESAGSALDFLSVKTLVLGHLPFEQYTHPYLEAVAATYERPFEQFSLPRAVYNLIRILRFFYTGKLKQVVIADPKLSKEYANAFVALIQKIPGFRVKVG
ncbi:MAG: 3'-5' exonuclease [Patescibacteria group bacterium]|nr:3'-5' exonuclease [Patescibacteria group bacterium]